MTLIAGYPLKAGNSPANHVTSRWAPMRKKRSAHSSKLSLPSVAPSLVPSSCYLR